MEKDQTMEILDKIRQARAELSISQRQIAKEADTSHAAVNKILSGKQNPGLRVLQKICKVLGLVVVVKKRGD